MGRKSKNIYCQYSLEDLKNAIQAVKEGQSTAGAARAFKIPRKTLVDHVSGRSSVDKRPGRARSIPHHIEDSICDKVVSAANTGFPVTKQQFLNKIGTVAENLNLKTQFKNGRPGKDYWYGLKSRRPDLTIRTPENCASNRMNMMTREVVGKYFADLEAFVARLELQDKPQQIWNCDETGLQFCPDASKVIAQRGTRNLVARCSPSKDSVTTMVCINAYGDAMPPMCVVKGKTKKSVLSFAVQDAPQNTHWTFQKSGWMDDVIGLEWFREVFLKNCGIARPQLLILDSHHSHEVLQLLELARTEDVHLLALPPHTTHMLQPLDRVVFKPLKTAYRRYCTEFLTSNPELSINKVTWPGLLSRAWNETMRKELLQKAFEATGIHPVNMDRIPDSAFALADRRSSAAATPSTLAVVSVDTEATSPETATSLEVQPSMINDTMASVETTISSTLEVISVDNDGEATSAETATCSEVRSVEDVNAIPIFEVDRSITEMVDVSFLNNLIIDVEGDEITIENLSKNMPTANWNQEVEDVFQFTSTPRKATSSRCIPSHRLLTSDAVIEEKRQAVEKKERQEAAKRERQERQQKRKMEATQGKSKKQTKK